jgi:hypothetical protein
LESFLLASKIDPSDSSIYKEIGRAKDNLPNLEEKFLQLEIQEKIEN